MADFPNSIFSKRARENKSGVNYDADKKTVIFVEDMDKGDDEITAIETELGTTPSGAFDTVKLWLTDLTNKVISVFTDLTDVPASYSGEGGKYVKVKGTEDGLEFGAGGAPASHNTTHENGGGDEVNVGGLSGELADDQPPKTHASAHQNGGGDEISVAGLSGELADDQPPKTHASAHQNGGGDEISVAGLSGELADNQPPKTHQSTHEAGQSDELTDAGIESRFVVVFIIDGGGSAIATGEHGHVRIPYKSEITKATLLADQSGSIKIDLWKDTYANFPPTNADTICGANEPEISASTKDEDATLTDWTKTVAAESILAFNVDSVTDIERVTIILELKKVE